MSKGNRGISRSFFLVSLAGVIVVAFSCDDGEELKSEEPIELSVARAAVTPEYVDDGRYDYGLSQPNPSYKVKVEMNVDIPMPDGTILKGDVYRPDVDGKFPVIMAESPFPRGAIGNNTGVDDNGGVGTRYQGFEQANPEYYIPRGYAYVTFSPRGYGGSQGRTSVLTIQEYYDIRDAIEWAAVQPWSDGNIGMFGISYYALSQYYVAGQPPPALKAIVPWEGLADPYRDICYRGGIPCTFGNGFGLLLGMLVTNPVGALNYGQIISEHPLMDDIWQYGADLTVDPNANKDIRVLDILEEIIVPMLSVGNLNDPDLHLRGNHFAFMMAPSPKKKLLLYQGTHWGSAYQPWANRTVLRFLDHWLKGIDTGIYNEPVVDVQLRTASDTFTHVFGDTWPLEQTEWTKYYLDASDKSLNTTEPGASSSVVTQYKNELGVGGSDQVTFTTAPLEQDIAVAGPLSAHFWVSSPTRDVDLTVELRDYDAEGKETRFDYYYAGDALEPVTRGWMRASLRALDPERSTEHIPFYTFSQNEWLTPGVPVAVDVEIWPTSILFKAGHNIALTIRSGSYNSPDPLYVINANTSGPAEIHTGGEHASWLELPVIPVDTAPVHQITVNDGDFTPDLVTGEMGDRFEWANAGDDYHSASESSGLNLWDSQLIRGSRSHNPETWWTHINWAGTFDYRDMVAVWDFKGTIAIPVSVPESVKGSATIVLGKTAPPEGTGFEVQLQKDGGEWSSIATDVSSTEITTDPLDKGTYVVRARVINLSDAEVASGWSPEVTFTVTEAAVSMPDAGSSHDGGSSSTSTGNDEFSNDGVISTGSDALTTCSEGYRVNNAGVCQDIDECAENTDTCDNSPDACINLTGEQGGYSCECPEGYKGDGIGENGCQKEADGGGCGCRVGVYNSTGMLPYQWLAGLLLMVFVLRRRRV